METGSIQFNKDGETVSWQLPHRRLIVEERNQFVRGLWISVVCWLVLLLLIFLKKINGDWISSLSLLVFSIVFFGAFFISSVANLCEVTRSTISIKKGVVRTREFAIFWWSKRVRAVDIQELIVKDQYQLMRFQLVSSLVFPPNKQAIIARTAKKHIVVCYGYPVELTRQLGKQLSQRLDKSLTEKTEGHALTIDPSSEVLQPPKSSIRIESNDGKSTTTYHVAPTISRLSQKAMVSLVALVLGSFSWLMYQIFTMSQDWNWVVFLVFVASICLIVFCLSHIPRQFHRHRIEVNAKEIWIVQQRLLSNSKRTIYRELIAGVSALAAGDFEHVSNDLASHFIGVTFHLKDGLMASVPLELPSQDLFWLADHLNRALGGLPIQERGKI